MNIVLVYNPRSGSALSAAELRRKCKKHDIAIDALLPMDNTLASKLTPYLDKKCIIAAIGGDGTLSGVANLIVGTSATFVPLPGGTLNHFTKDLGISQDIDEAWAQLRKGKVRRIDVGVVNGTVFINNSSMGLYPSSLGVREQFEDRLGKWPAAVIGSLKALWHYRTYTVSVNGEQFKTPFLFVGNNDYHLDDPDTVGRSQLDEGILSVYAVASASRWALVKLLMRAATGQIAYADEIKVWKTTEITIHTKKQRIRISRDGELEKSKTPLHYKIKAGSLKIIGSS